ncbi:hypothetical protein C2G38_2237919 [Gigaspora rosea]|uniref:Sel1 repeat family protein n=1 Tax=Gigaspora rosea TaxID=44941 RepID=A0A397WB90_9GLOM|nr:hypothetical protein C2G38_2237919 [Gigaspora rosea]
MSNRTNPVYFCLEVSQNSIVANQKYFRPTIAKIFLALYEYHHKDKRKEILPIGDDDFMLIDKCCQENLQHATILFKEETDLDKVEAQFRYGSCLWQGPVNRNEAITYLKLADDNGNPTTMYNVGSAYWIGKRVIKDQEIDSKYLKMAAKKEHNAIAMCKKLRIPY